MFHIIKRKDRMDNRQHSSQDCKRMSLDKLLGAMTADLENTSGQFVQFEISNQQDKSYNWNEYAPTQVQYMNNSAALSNLSNIPSVNQISPLFVQDIPQYNPSSTECIYLPSQNANHLEKKEKNDLIRTIDIGGGSFINVVYGNTTQFMTEQCQLSDSLPYTNIDQEYELFNNQEMQVCTPTFSLSFLFFYFP